MVGVGCRGALLLRRSLAPSLLQGTEKDGAVDNADEDDTRDAQT